MVDPQPTVTMNAAAHQLVGIVPVVMTIATVPLVLVAIAITMHATAIVPLPVECVVPPLKTAIHLLVVATVEIHTSHRLLAVTTNLTRTATITHLELGHQQEIMEFTRRDPVHATGRSSSFFLCWLSRGVMRFSPLDVAYSSRSPTCPFLLIYRHERVHQVMVEDWWELCGYLVGQNSSLEGSRCRCWR